MGTCSQSNCFAEETGCSLGCLSLTDCSNWTGENEPASVGTSDPKEALKLPWTGHALGLTDLSFVAGASKPFVVGIVGPQNAGKTTLLGSWYLMLGRNPTRLAESEFAGSYSLAGWEAVANSLRFKPGSLPRFPPHTSSREARAPGLLHFDLRRKDETLSSYVFTDAPGEWFQKWAINKDSSESEGARWVAQHADAFLIIADCEALAGPDLGVARSSLQLLAKRLSAELLQRPVALVWTKSDVKVKPEVETDVREAIRKSMPEVVEFQVSVRSKERGGAASDTAFSAVLNWVLGLRRKHVSLPPPELPGTGDSLFLYGKR